LSFQVPKIHLTFCDVAESTYHEHLTKRTDLDGVFELLSEFKLRFTIEIVQGGTSRLLSRNYDELLAIWSPFHVLDLVVKDRNEFSILALVNSDVLKRVFTVVTFTC
jgi:hypothetical protein